MADGWDSYPHDWDERRRVVYQRDEYQCQNCGRRGGAAGNAELHCHHIVPKSKGGSHDMNNLVTLCRDCHNQVHDHHIPKMSEVSSGGQSQNAGLDDWQSSTQASESLQSIANKHFESDTQTIEEESQISNQSSEKEISTSDTHNRDSTDIEVFGQTAKVVIVFCVACYVFAKSYADSGMQSAMFNLIIFSALLYLYHWWKE